jgi:hypothetical protein
VNRPTVRKPPSLAGRRRRTGRALLGDFVNALAGVFLRGWILTLCFLAAVERKPADAVGLPSVAFMISARVAPVARPSSRMTSAFLQPSRFLTGLKRHPADAIPEDDADRFA